MCIVQYLVVYQCIVAEASTTAFYVDGSSLSTLQVPLQSHIAQHCVSNTAVSCM